MSLNHILKTARKLGIPVVITNERGETPQVVMPFDDFASMVGISSPVGSRNRPHLAFDEDEDDGIFEDDFEEEDDVGIRGNIADLDDHFTIEPNVEEELPQEIPLTDSAPTDDKSLEDRFYFEPEEDKEHP